MLTVLQKHQRTTTKQEGMEELKETSAREGVRSPLCAAIAVAVESGHGRVNPIGHCAKSLTGCKAVKW